MQSINMLVNELPTDGMPVSLLACPISPLRARDKTPVRFNNMVWLSTSEADERLLRRFIDRDISLYNDAANPYDRGVQINTAAEYDGKSLGIAK